MRVCSNTNCNQGRKPCADEWCYVVDDDELDDLIARRVAAVLVILSVSCVCAAAWSLWGSVA